MESFIGGKTATKEILGRAAWRARIEVKEFIMLSQPPFPALRSDPIALSEVYRSKQTPSSQSKI